MGNCASPAKKSAAEIAPDDCGGVKPTRAVSSSRRTYVGTTTTNNSNGTASSTTVRLYGSPESLLTSYIRYALMYKEVPLRFIPSEAADSGVEKKLTIQLGSETVSGSRETLLGFIEEKFPNPPLLMVKFNLEGFDETTPLIVKVVWLQHRSILWHVEKMMRWADDLLTRGGRKAFDPAVGSPVMELKKFGKKYSQLLELMLEHAQMEERVVFPVLESADRGICKVANEEHARDLPIMNGIKEDIKSIGVMNSGSPAYNEAFCNLSDRFKSLQEHFKEHSEEEERDVLPMMEAIELSSYQQKKLLDECFDVMRGTHSHLFSFLLEGFLPREAMQYLDLIMKFGDEERTPCFI